MKRKHTFFSTNNERGAKIFGSPNEFFSMIMMMMMMMQCNILANQPQRIIIEECLFRYLVVSVRCQVSLDLLRNKIKIKSKLFLVNLKKRRRKKNKNFDFMLHSYILCSKNSSGSVFSVRVESFRGKRN